MANLSTISPGKHIPDDLNVIIEIPANGGALKYEFDKESGMIMVDRFMPTAMHYPCNYGFIPNTLAEDGDPVDILVMTPAPVQPGCLMRVRAIGMLLMTDEAGKDSKVLAVPVEKACLQYKEIQTLDDVSQTVRDSLVHFFEHYKDLEPNKWVKVDGWADKAAAAREIEASIVRYKAGATV